MRKQLLALRSAKQPSVAVSCIDVVELPRARVERAVEDRDVCVAHLERGRHHAGGLLDARLQRRDARYAPQRGARGGHHQ